MGLNLALFFSALFYLGLPIVETWRAGLLFVFLLCFFFSNGRGKLACALILLATGIAVRLIPRVTIHEGHQIFWTREMPEEPMREFLPPKVYDVLSKEFLREYPRSSWTQGSVKSWLGWNQFPSKPFAFSADGIWQNPTYSRIHHHFSFHDLASFRAGFINELGSEKGVLNTIFYDWLNRPDDIQRATTPYYVFYEFDKNSIGGEFCFQGQIFAQGRLFESQRKSCFYLPESWAGKRIYGLGISRDPKLSLSFEPPSKFYWLHFVKNTLTALAFASSLLLLVRPKKKLFFLSFWNRTIHWRPLHDRFQRFFELHSLRRGE